mmetsp:Transcript_31083/g.89635  ORF Transcript_31083/g.89635 Transcript_31083/m.89635 type:complete len:219 (+) Transcript_31083:1491-2147(+)
MRPAAVERHVHRFHRGVLLELRNQHPSAVHQHGGLAYPLHARATQHGELTIRALVGLRPYRLDVLLNDAACLLPVQGCFGVALRQRWGLVLAALDAPLHVQSGRLGRERLLNLHQSCSLGCMLHLLLVVDVEGNGRALIVLIVLGNPLHGVHRLGVTLLQIYFEHSGVDAREFVGILAVDGLLQLEDVAVHVYGHHSRVLALQREPKRLYATTAASHR